MICKMIRACQGGGGRRLWSTRGVWVVDLGLTINPRTFVWLTQVGQVVLDLTMMVVL